MNNHRIRFEMNGIRYCIPTKRRFTEEEFCTILYKMRRLLGYIVYPRWFVTRMFLSEVIEMLKKNHVYKHEIKKSCTILLKYYDALEGKHTRDFDREFIEVMAASLSDKGIKKVNEIRGALGGVLLNGGVKHYLIYSYPYTLLNLCYDNISSYYWCVTQIYQKHGIDFNKTFESLKGEEVYFASVQLMKRVVEAFHEEVGKLTIEGSGCMEKLEALDRIMLSNESLHDAFMEAYNEVGADRSEQDLEEMKIWEDSDFAERLAEKFKVTKSKK